MDNRKCFNFILDQLSDRGPCPFTCDKEMETKKCWEIGDFVCILTTITKDDMRHLP